MSGMMGCEQTVEQKESFQIENLTVEYMQNPIGIEKDLIRFAWNMKSDVTGKRQTAYEITVFDGDTAVWNSGKTESGRSVGIPYEGDSLSDAHRYTWLVTVWDENDVYVVSDSAFFEIGVSKLKEWKEAKFIAMNSSSHAPIFRVEKKLGSQKLCEARLYITALGVYTAYINGQEVYATEETGTVYHHMNPGYGNRSVSLTYQTYDVTDMIDRDTVALSAMCGTGWMNGMAETNASPALKALLILTYENGEKQYIATNTTDWKGTLQTPVTANGVYYGEDYDAGIAEKLGDFASVGYDDSKWVNALTVRTYPGIIRSGIGTAGRRLEAYTKEAVSATIYHGENVIKEYSGVVFEKEILLQKGQTLVLNMGQNMSAIPQAEFSAKEGTVLTMRFAEMLNDGSRISNEPTGADGPKGSVYQKSLRGARSRAVYTFAGKEREQYQPKTSFFGYQYIEITATEDVTLYSVKSQALSSVSRQTGTIKTNNENVNRLFENVLYGQLSNYFTTSTDCNQRDERLFWSGDTQAFAQTAVYNFDSFAFLKELQAVMDENTMIKGYTPSVVDDLNGYFSNWAAGWSDVLVIVPWTVYLQTGDKLVLEQSYNAMTRYMSYLEREERGENQAPLSERNFGDWLSFQGTSVEVISDYYYAYVTELMEKIARLLGDEERAVQYHQKWESIRDTFLATYVTFENEELLIHSRKGNTAKQFHYAAGKGGAWENNSQTALLWFLKSGFATSEEMKEAAVKLLVENIKNETSVKGSVRRKYGKNTLAAGFLGSNVLLPVLQECGAGDVAYDLLLQDENPSWLFEVKAGATTIWERWNSYTPGKGFGDSEMNSFNHYAYGSVAEWMYRYMLGIEHAEDVPGFQKVILQPSFDTGIPYNEEERINRVEGSYESLYGKISVAWESEDGKMVSYKVTLPANTTGELYLPTEEAALQKFAAMDGVVCEGMVLHHGKCCAKLLLESGEYNFSYGEGV